jgi:hypothetical protein
MQLTSDAFAPGGEIPTRFTGEGDDVSPQLAWSNAPDEAKSFAVICHDPDAPLVKDGNYGFVHWVLYNLPGSTSALAEGTGEGTAGVNDFGNSGYGGPMPPEGHGTHHYFFWVLAFDRELDLKPGLTLNEFLKQSEPNLIAMNRLTGTYRRA